MSDPVLVAVPPKGGSLDDVLKKLVARAWVRPDLVAGIRRLLKDDKRRVKLEEGLIELWLASGCAYEPTMRAADRFGHDLDEVDAALKRMRRWRDDQGRERLDYAGKATVEAMLHVLGQDNDPVIREAASALHLQLDLTRPGKPSRMVFNHLEFSFSAPARPGSAGSAPVRGVLMGTDHEVTPTWLRRNKRDLSLTCYDAFHNTLMDVLDLGAVRNWQELKAHLIESDTAVRILGSLGLDDYLGHCVLMGSARAERVRALLATGAPRRWAVEGDPKLGLLAGESVLIDPAYEEIYGEVLGAKRHGIRLSSGPKDIERVCAAEDRVAIYIVRSGSTVAVTDGLCVVGDELITSETIVAVNQDSLDRNPGIGVLVDSLAPGNDDHTAAWRAKLAKRLGNRLV